MGWRRIATAGLATTIGLLTLALGVPAASASTGDIIAPQHPPLYTPQDGWQAGTCSKDTPTCSVGTPEQFFEQAAGHPPVGFTQFIVKHEAPGESPVGELKDVRVDLPVGLSVNPGATLQCSQEAFEASTCLPASRVGTSFVTAAIPPLGIAAPAIEAAVYNLIPPPGRPARFGLNLAGNNVYLEADVAWDGDFHEGFSIAVPQVANLEPLIKGLILKNRLVFDGTSGDGTFITTPSTCLGPSGVGPGHSGSAYSTYLLAASYAEETGGYQFPTDAVPAFESPIPPGTSPKECATIPYSPGIEVNPNTPQTDSPAGASVAVTVPHIKSAGKQDSSVTRAASVALPVGMGLNPSAANGLQTCADDQFPTKSKAAVTCPPQSKIGTVDDRIAAASRRQPQRQRLCRQAAQPRSELGRRVQDLRRGWVGSVWGPGEADRQSQSRPHNRAVDDDLLRNATGSLHLLQAQLRRRPASRAQQPGQLWPERD